MTQIQASQDAHQAAEYLSQISGIDQIDLALVLGSGWAAAANRIGQVIATAELAQVPGFVTPTADGHGAEAIIVHTDAGQQILVLTGRTHLYEGKGVAQVVHGVHTAAAWGADRIVLTNGCGGINPSWQPGTVVMVRDHINLTASTPLSGATFVDMSHAYSPQLRDLVHEVAPDLPEGVYAQFHGPQFETPAEVAMAGRMGADLVGMSTAVEVIAARALGLEVLALSLVTNLAAGISPTPLNHQEVLAAGQAATGHLVDLITKVVGQI